LKELYLQLQFNLPVEGPFTYLPPEQPEAADTTEWKGKRVTAPFGSRSLTGYIVGTSAVKPDGDFTLRRVSKLLDKEPLFGDPELSLARWMASMYLSTTGEALGVILPGAKKESSAPSFGVEEEIALHKPLHLSPEQSAALAGILHGSSSPKYLSGITGSGKTEVFLRAAEAMIEEGKGVIYLVPEIALTHQLVDAVKGRFSGKVALLHSGLSPGKKLSEWQRLRQGDALLAVGARSAVFAPLPRLGMIIIDEEHEGSYKSGSVPRYHARQIAMHRCSSEDALLVMGSATPSVEAVQFMETGTIEKLVLHSRIAGGKLPKIAVVDMKGKKSTLSPQLTEAIRAVKTAGRQTILFLNRRGFSYFFHCRSCGYQMTCNSCSVSLTLHKSSSRMRCHYCGYSRAPVDVCPDCGSLDVGYSGFGTEKIEEDVRRVFPDLSVSRIDTDAVRKKGVLQHTLEQFREGNIDILLGTQMVAKGLNFPGVRLVGIVQADSALHLPDFRSRERTYSLITQVAGRAGRYDDEGMVIIQTFTPEDPAIKLAAEGRAEQFYQLELGSRRDLRFPPFARLVRLVFRGRDREKVERSCDEAVTLLQENLSSEAEILGPAECPIAIISGNHRFQLLLRAEKLSLLLPAVHSYRSRTGSRESAASCYVEYDVDPVSLL
jgi:primosomal protein N' (replication factor Y) (superfamily II helicase)